MNLKLIGHAKTHPGLVRDSNEDSVSFHTHSGDEGNVLGLMIVADGMGGHLAGEIASQLAVDTIYTRLNWLLNGSNKNKSGNPTADLESLLSEAVEDANQKIFEYSQENSDFACNLGTTITCGLISDKLITLAHVGDSRAYRLRDNDFQQLTNDHTFVGEMVREGHLPKEAYYVHPRRHVITRALGQQPFVQVDTFTDQVQNGDKFLLCTDGLWEMVRDDAIQKYLNKVEIPETVTQLLTDKALEKGGVDNIGLVYGAINARE
jgi:protein phosphatase